MKFRFLNESDELWSSDKYYDEPRSQNKLPYYCEARPLKAALKTLSDPKEIEDAINYYSKSGKYRYIGTVEYNGNTFLRFDSGNDRYSGSTFWYCRNYSNGMNIEKIKHEIPEGSILAIETGYSMVIYEFYRVEKYQGKSIVLSKLEKIRSDDGFKPYVSPGRKAVSTDKYKISVSKYDMIPYVALDYDTRLDLDQSKLYKPSKRYQEDHLD